MPVASLPHGDQRKLEVALLMALDPRSSCSTNPPPA
jgi:branched-chain amino acid transport system ATP-binding protein